LGVRRGLPTLRDRRGALPRRARMLTVPFMTTDLKSIWSTVFVSASSRCVATKAEIPRLPDASGSIARFANSDDETVDQHTVSPVQKSGPRAPTPHWERVCADLIMACLQQQSTCERPHIFQQLESSFRRTDKEGVASLASDDYPTLFCRLCWSATLA
jgi:hypothetical protein